MCQTFPLKEPLPSCSPNRVARDPAGFHPPPLPSCSPNRVACDPASFTEPPLSSCSPNRVAQDPAGVNVTPLPSCSPNRVAYDPASVTVPQLPSFSNCTPRILPCPDSQRKQHALDLHCGLGWGMRLHQLIVTEGMRTSRVTWRVIPKSVVCQ